MNTESTTSPRRPTILIAGGDRDPHLECLRDRLSDRDVEVLPLLIGAHEHSVTWDIGADRLEIDGRAVSPDAAFVRFDAFAPRTPAAGHRASAWYTTVMAWIAGHPTTRAVNRSRLDRLLWKPHVLHCAASLGIPIPETMIGNQIERVSQFVAGRPKIAKPVNGGGLCQRLDDVLSTTEQRAGTVAAPAIVQPELVGPELRIYACFGKLLGLSIASEELDYRSNSDYQITPVAVPAEIGAGLLRLMIALGLDFASADFKTCPESGRFLFLEINDAPMFAASDAVCGGAITDAVADFLEGSR